MGDLAGLPCPGDFPGVPRAEDFPGVVCAGDFVGGPWTLFRTGVTCLTSEGTPFGTPLGTAVLIARTREGVLSPAIESDLCILLIAGVEGAILTGGERAEKLVERELESD